MAIDTQDILTLTHAVLLVDDQREFLQLARMLLSGHPGVAIVGAATSGAEALALLPKLEPEVVVLDVQMPGMNGFEAARRLLDAMPGLQIVLMSAFDEGRYGDLARAAGAKAFLRKTQLSADAILGIVRSGGGSKVMGQEHPARRGAGEER